MLRLRFFAQCADEVGGREKSVPFCSSPHQVLESHPSLACLRNRPHLKVAVNRTWANWDTPLKDGDEVAFLPPVNGG
jgi:molybdopterin synthase sulfur carrier subunit